MTRTPLETGAEWVKCAYIEDELELAPFCQNCLHGISHHQSQTCKVECDVCGVGDTCKQTTEDWEA